VSSLFAIGSRLHVYLTADPEKTGCLDRLRHMAFKFYDRDVVVDLASVRELSEQGILVLLTLNTLLHEAGHQLTLHAPSPEVKACLTGFRVDHIFHYSEYEELHPEHNNWNLTRPARTGSLV
jgi:anti-anti-sigma regulatory factor